MNIEIFTLKGGNHYVRNNHRLSRTQLRVGNPTIFISTSAQQHSSNQHKKQPNINQQNKGQPSINKQSS